MFLFDFTKININQYKIMLNLILLTGVALLVFRVLWVIFGFFERLFTTQQQSKIKEEPPKTASQIIVDSSSSKQNINVKTANKPKEMFLEKEIKMSKIPIQEIKHENKSEISSSAIKQKERSQYKQQNKQKVVQQTVRANENSSIRDSSQERVLLQNRQSNIQNNSNNERMKQYESTIQKKNQEIQNYKRVSENYIKKIEEIMQHAQQIVKENNSLNQQLNQDRGEVQRLTSALQQQRKQTNRLRQMEISLQNQLQIVHQQNSVIQNDRQRFKSQYELEIIAKKEGNVNYQQPLMSENKLLKQAQIKLKQELNNLKEQLFKNQNDQLQKNVQYCAQIDSLKVQKQQIDQLLVLQHEKFLKIQQELQQINARLQHEKNFSEKHSKQTSGNEEKIAILQQNAERQKIKILDIEKQLDEVKQELKFCQQQLANSQNTQAQLRQKLVKAIESPKKSESSFIKKEDVQKHPQYLRMKRKVEQLQGKRVTLSPDEVSKPQVTSSNYSSIFVSNNNTQEREVSPTFAVSKRQATSPSSQAKGVTKSVRTPVIQHQTPGNTYLASTIMVDRRYNTPVEKPVAYSSIHEGGILGEIYLGETRILNQHQRNIVMAEVSNLKKITAKKTRLIYSSLQKVNKPITEYIVSAPNVILIMQLANKKIVGAFTQNAFSKDNKFTKSSIVSKAMIFDLNNEVFMLNEGKGEIIHFQQNALIWGNNQFVISCQEPVSLSVNLNCEGAVYPSNSTTQQFLNSEEQTIAIAHMQVYRVFLG